jgi:hypothetical protein
MKRSSMVAFFVAAVFVLAAAGAWRALAASGVYGLSGISVPADKSAYVGEWSSPGYQLSIAPSGKIHYERHTSNVETKLDVPIQKFAGDDFVAGALFWTTTFHVTEPPHHTDSGWRMTSDGVTYTRP